MAAMRRFVSAALLLGACMVSAQDGSLDDIRALVREGRLEAALEAVQTRLAQDPQNRQARFVQGVVLAEMKQTDAAIEVFSGLAEAYPELPEPHNNLAVLYASRGDYERARDALLQAINTHPSYATAHENLGDIYAKMAGLAYGRALSIDTDNTAAKKKLALIDGLFTASPASAVVSSPPPAVAEPEPTVVAAAVPSTADADPAAAVAPPTSASTSEEVIAAVEDWAAAWSSKDVTRYLAWYSPDFQPTGRRSRASWEAQRRERVARPAFIEVEIVDPVVRSTSVDRAQVTFVQRYRSDTYRDAVRKRITLRRTALGWKIVRERSLGKI